MIFRQLFDRESCTYTYLIGDEATRVAALVDPVREHVTRDLDLVKQLGLQLTHIFETHVHADHITGAGDLRKLTGAKGCVAQRGGAACADVPLIDGDVVKLGDDLELRALSTPGHTSGCLSYVILAGGKTDRVLTGDALFVRGCGRTDFQEGDAGTLYDSVHQRLFAFPDETWVYPAHDYRGMTVSTIGEEKRFNPRLGGSRTRAEFIALMEGLNLPPPTKLAEAVPANRACGDVAKF